MRRCGPLQRTRVHLGEAVLIHSWGGDKSDEQVIETTSIYARAGYGVLLLDRRGQGASGGERRTLGLKIRANWREFSHG